MAGEIVHSEAYPHRALMEEVNGGEKEKAPEKGPFDKQFLAPPGVA